MGSLFVCFYRYPGRYTQYCVGCHMGRMQVLRAPQWEDGRWRVVGGGSQMGLRDKIDFTVKFVLSLVSFSCSPLTQQSGTLRR